MPNSIITILHGLSNLNFITILWFGYYHWALLCRWGNSCLEVVSHQTHILLRCRVGIYTQLSLQNAHFLSYILHYTSIRGIATSFLWCHGFSSAKFRDDKGMPGDALLSVFSNLRLYIICKNCTWETKTSDMVYFTSFYPCICFFIYNYEWIPVISSGLCRIIAQCYLLSTSLLVQCFNESKWQCCTFLT